MPAPHAPKAHSRPGRAIPPGLEPTLGPAREARKHRPPRRGGATAPGGHEFDLAAAQSLLSDRELREWMGASRTRSRSFPVTR